MRAGGHACLAVRKAISGLMFMGADKAMPASLSSLTGGPDQRDTRRAGWFVRIGVRDALFCCLVVLTSPAWARGPLLLPESPPPNLATLDTDALRTKATKGDAAAAADLGAVYAHGW